MDYLNNLKALLIILVIAVSVFAIAKPVCLRFMENEDFILRRNVWYTLTISAFLSPSIWLYFLIAVPVMTWAGQKDSNPLALYVILMYVIPPYEIDLPTVIVNDLFALSNIRVLAFTVLLPQAFKLLNSDKKLKNRYGIFDFGIVAFVFLQLILLLPYESITNTMRRGVLMALDILLVYYVASRGSSNRRALGEVMCVFALSCMIFAPIAVFESIKTWLLYVELADTWEVFSPRNYLLRAGVLRAQASTGHSLTLGGLMAIGFGFWLYLGKSSNLKRAQFAMGFAWIWMGLLAAYSRAPWVAAVISYLVYILLNPGRIQNLSKIFLAGSVALGALLMSPLGDRVIDSLPIVGTIDEDNVIYRQRLVEKSWELIQQNPIFGDPFFMEKMEDLRQGEGIIDLVNAYASVALGTGIVGLILFTLPILLGLIRSLILIRNFSDKDNNLAAIGTVLAATVVGYLFLIGSGGIGRGQGFYLISGLIIGYTKISQTRQSGQVV